MSMWQNTSRQPQSSECVSRRDGSDSLSRDAVKAIMWHWGSISCFSMAWTALSGKSSEIIKRYFSIMWTTDSIVVWFFWFLIWNAGKESAPKSPLMAMIFFLCNWTSLWHIVIADCAGFTHSIKRNRLFLLKNNNKWFRFSCCKSTKLHIKFVKSLSQSKFCATSMLASWRSLLVPTQRVGSRHGWGHSNCLLSTLCRSEKVKWNSRYFLPTVI